MRNYLEELPCDIKLIIYNIKEELEKKLEVGDMFIFTGKKFKILKINDKSYRVAELGSKTQETKFIKGDSIDESIRLIEIMYFDNKIKNESRFLKSKVETEQFWNNIKICKSSNPTSILYNFKINNKGHWQYDYPPKYRFD